MLTKSFSGKELFTYWREHVTFRVVTVAVWDELKEETQQRWNKMAAMINQRMKGEAT